MRLEIAAVPVSSSTARFAVRALIFNDSFEPVPLSRNSFYGPTPSGLTASGMPLPESAEATHGASDEPMTLQPFTFYGRERRFDELAAGDHEFTAEYRVDDPAQSLREVTTLTVSSPSGEA